ncbi:FAD-dependent oxidoreductase [Nocardia sp. R6R-6]|uniref:FAD-dependent oxidoreductase n=1 Tax=Nocardia sp. R6R-6 TaxID=3459303 RepID=UPI00403D76BE
MSKELPNPDGHLVVVGAGIAGVRVVEATRSAGWAGPISLVGNQPGLPYDLPPLSKNIISGTWTAKQAELISYEMLDALAVRYFEFDPAVQLDRRRNVVSLNSGIELTYDTLVIASGARAKPLSGNPRVHTIRTMADAEQLRDRLNSAAPSTVVVVGSGFIAAEAAAAISRYRDHAVHLVCRGPGPCAKSVGPPLARWLRELHEKNGVVVHAQRTGTIMERCGAMPLEVILDDGRTLVADVAIGGVGSEPNLEWIGSANIPTDQGVLTDADGRVVGTPDEFIFAVGDCAQWGSSADGVSRGQHWTRAVDQARHVGLRLGSGNYARDADTTRPATVPYVWSDQYESTIQVMGNVSPEDDVHHLVLDDTTAMAVYGKGAYVTGVVSVGLPRAALKIRKAMKDSRRIEDILAHV